MSRTFLPHVITDDSALGGNVIEKSLRFNDDDAIDLRRTLSSSGNRRTFTWSGWVKRSSFAHQALFSSTTEVLSGNSHTYLLFNSSHQLVAQSYEYSGGGTKYNLKTTRLFRDHNAWYHIVWAVDTTQSTSSNRVKFYVNGEQVTSFSTETYPSQNYEGLMNNSSYKMLMGNAFPALTNNSPFDGYMTEINFVDGSALDPSHFGYTESQTGLWRPKRFDKSSIPNKKGRTFSGSGWTVSGGAGFSGSKPITNAYNGSIGTSNSDVANNSAGGAYLTWDTSAYNLTGNLRIFCWSDGGEYDIYVNGNSGSTTKVGDTPSGSGNAAWIDCGTFDHIKEIQFSGTTYNTDTGLGSSGVYIAGFMVNGTLLRDDMDEFGTNGFHLEFKDNSSTSALGKDTSGNGNDFTANNFSVTAGKDDDSMIDTPTNNFPTFNLSNRSSGPTISNGNLRMYYNYKPASKTTRTTFRFPKSGKYYYEWQNEESSSNPGRWQSGIINVVNEGTNTFDIQGYNDADIVSYSFGGSIWNGTTHVSSSWDGTTRSWYSPERAAWAVDCDTGNVWLGRVASDGTTQWWAPDGSATGNPSKLLNPTCGIDKDKTHEYLPFMSFHEGGGASSTAFAININFGQHSFLGTIPDGFKTLSSANIQPDPIINTIVRPKKHFGTLTWTGNATVRTISDTSTVDFTPDMVWVKCRSNTHDHQLTDAVRGTSKALTTNTTGAEIDWDVLYSGNNKGMGDYVNGGFILDDNGNNARYNQNSQTFVAWCWKAGGAAVANTDGSITSQVSVNEEAGFSIATYTGSTASGALTVGHGLGKKPAWVIIRRRDSTGEWIVGHQGLATDAFANNKFLKLDANNSTFTNSLVFGVEPTTTVTQIVTNGAGGAANLTSSGTYVMYSWAEIPGFSKFSSYTGNGSSDGPFVHLGFRPAFIMFKNTSTTTNWELYDTTRPYGVSNPALRPLYANHNYVEETHATLPALDILSDGFKPRSTWDEFNKSGDTIIYMAFAEQPGATSFDTFANAR